MKSEKLSKSCLKAHFVEMLQSKSESDDRSPGQRSIAGGNQIRDPGCNRANQLHPALEIRNGACLLQLMVNHDGPEQSSDHGHLISQISEETARCAWFLQLTL